MAQPRLPVWLVAVVLVVVTMALYWPATRLGYATADDEVYVTANVHVQPTTTWASPSAGKACLRHPSLSALNFHEPASIQAASAPP
jgi:hypothetical protein